MAINFFFMISHERQSDWFKGEGAVTQRRGGPPAHPEPLMPKSALERRGWMGGDAEGGTVPGEGQRPGRLLSSETMIIMVFSIPVRDH
jgi:hypothetical protein